MLEDGPVCIVSGPPRESKVHFEGFISKAPSGAGPRGDGPVHRLVQRRQGPNGRAGAAHVYFEVVHPFADGNGRVGRAVSEIALSQELGRPAPFSLSAAINERRDGYCSSLEIAQKGDMNVTEWLVWFADTVRRAQEDAKEKTTWVLFKTKFRDVHADSFNDRRKRVIARMFRAGIEGFEGGVDERKHAKPAECGARAAANGIVELLAMGAFKEIPSAGRRTRCDILIDR